MRIMRIAVACAIVGGVWIPAGHAEFKAAIAVKVVTPDPLLPVSGGVGASKIPATVKQGDLTVRALVIEQDKVRVAIACGDFLGFPGVLGNRVRAEVKGIPPENILIGVTHGHSAPDMYGFTNAQGETGANLKYIDFVCKEMAKAINEAIGKLEPVTLKIAEDEAKGKIAYNYYAPQLYDPRMNVIQFLSKDKPIATLVNYATHPEVIGAGQRIISPDLSGPLYDRIAEKGGGTAIFMNSAQGGMVTADNRDPNGGKDIGTWEECLRIGQLMADEALRIVGPAPVLDNPKLACFSTKLTLPVDSPLMKAMLANSPVDSTSRSERGVVTQVNVVNLGPAQILTIPGEALPNVGYYLKRKMNGKPNLLFGLTNDAFGYMMTKVDYNSFKRYDYISRTTLGENTADIYTEKALEFVNKCPKPAQ